MSEVFLLGNFADELLEHTLEICGKDENKTPRFPARFYQNYVHMMIDAAGNIQKCIVIANEEDDKPTRYKLQKRARGYCVHLNHLIRIAASRKWISEKERDRWSKKVTKISYMINNWMKSDKK